MKTRSSSFLKVTDYNHKGFAFSGAAGNDVMIMDNLKNTNGELRLKPNPKRNDTISSRFNNAIVKHFKKADMFGTNDNLYKDEGPVSYGYGESV